MLRKLLKVALFVCSIFIRWFIYTTATCTPFDFRSQWVHCTYLFNIQIYEETIEWIVWLVHTDILIVYYKQRMTYHKINANLIETAMTLADNNKYYYTERNRCVLPVQPVQAVQPVLACTRQRAAPVDATAGITSILTHQGTTTTPNINTTYNISCFGICG